MTPQSDEVVFLQAMLTIFAPIIGLGFMITLSPLWVVIGLLLFLFGMRAWWRAFSGNDPFWGE